MITPAGGTTPRRHDTTQRALPRPWRRALLAGLAAASALLLPAAVSGAAEEPKPPSELRDVRYCEIIPSLVGADTVTSHVYNTLGWNDCPADLWKAITVEQVNREYGSQAASLNGPRHWVIDGIEGFGETASGGTFSFGGIKMSQRATVTKPLSAASSKEEPYSINEIERETAYTFKANRPMYELTDPQGRVYAMQAYAQIVDPDLSLAQLSKLGGRLKLPKGWSYAVRTPNHQVTMNARGKAYLVQDDLLNSYQRMAKPSVAVTKRQASCAKGPFKLEVRVQGDTAVTHVKVGERQLKRSVKGKFSASFGQRYIHRGHSTVVATARNDAGVTRASASFPVCG